MYNVQCLCGHTSFALPGSELETRCKEYEAQGRLDALRIGSTECGQCQSDLEMRNRQAERMLSDWGF